MATRIPSGLKLAILLIGIAVLFFAIDWYRHRFVRSDEDLLKLLPGGDATVFYARAQVLHPLIDAHTADPEYQAFMRDTRFDYTKDVDALAGSADSRGTMLAVKGRFDWGRIQNYIRKAGGSCADNRCSMQGSKQQHWIGVVQIQPDVIGIALGSDKSLSKAIHPYGQAMTPPLPAEPVWVKLAPELLKHPSALPAALRIFMISLQPADWVILSIAPPPSGSSDAFEIRLNARCQSAAIADTVRRQLELETKMLKLELRHERQQPNAADLTGLLTAGAFYTSANEVRGDWPVRKELLTALQ